MIANLDIDLLKTFLAIADMGNFTRAAELCHVSQPALTKAIKNLEDELGGELLRRERGNTHLTELGQLVRVRNIDTSRIVMGRLIDRNIVEVDP